MSDVKTICTLSNRAFLMLSDGPHPPWQYEPPPTTEMYLGTGGSDGEVCHRFVHINGCKRACAYCNILGVKTKSGWAIKSYYKCDVCDTPLCRNKKDCFEKYHDLVKLHHQDGMTHKDLQRVMKLALKNKSLLDMNETGSMAEPIVFMDDDSEFVNINQSIDSRDDIEHITGNYRQNN